MATKLEKTRDEQNQDDLLAKFGFVDGEFNGAPAESDGSANPGDDPTGKTTPEVPGEGGEGAKTGEGGEGEGAELGGENPNGTPGGKPVLKGWEKRAADNQHNYHLERNAREKVEKVAMELQAELARQRAEFAALLEKVGKVAEHAVAVAEHEDDPLTDYPEIATGVNGKLKPLVDKIADLESKISKTEAKSAVDAFLDKVASPEGGNIPEIRSIIGDPGFNEWLDNKGGYSERVMRQTFNKEFGFTERDVAEVVGRWMAETGKTPKTNERTPEKAAPPERPRVPSGSGGLKGAETADIFTEEEMGNLRALADKAGRAFAKGLDKDALTKFDEKLTRSINFYDKKK